MVEEVDGPCPSHKVNRPSGAESRLSDHRRIFDDTSILGHPCTAADYDGRIN